MKSAYSLPTWMINQVNQKEKSQPTVGSKKSLRSENQKKKEEVSK